jgi:hypothetical protein
MSDFDERLSSFDPGPPMNPLPPSDVRRQGDRLRRRNTVLAGVGAAVAVAVIATPLAILGTRGDGDATPDPAPALPSPTVTESHSTGEPVRVTIPDGIDITTGMAENESQEPVVATAGGEGIAEMVMCDVPELTDEGVLDRLAAHASGPEYTDSRELRLYGSVDEARAVIDGMVEAVEGCPTQDFSTTTWVNQVSERHLGEESYTVSTTYLENDEPTIGGIWWHVVRVGNAIFAASGTGEAYPGPSFENSLEEGANELAPIIASFQCFFSDASCSSEGTSVVLGPDGVGQLLLGMTPEEIEATGEATSTQGSAHDGFPPGCEVVAFARGLYDEVDPSGFNGQVSPDQGLELVTGTRGWSRRLASASGRRWRRSVRPIRTWVRSGRVIT